VLLVVADTSPIRYLVQIGHIRVLPELFERIFIPSLVYDELRHGSAPAPVRAWASELPAWVEARRAPVGNDPALRSLDDGENSALMLGMTLGAQLILIDERKGAAVALKKGFEVTGTLGLLTRATQCGLLDLRDSLEQLKGTNFHYRQELFDELLTKYSDSGHRYYGASLPMVGLVCGTVSSVPGFHWFPLVSLGFPEFVRQIVIEQNLHETGCLLRARANEISRSIVANGRSG
jgi:predicted nucleic acid-binding protein